MLSNAYVMLNIKSKLLHIKYLYISQLYCNFEESSLINIVQNYNHRLALHDSFKIVPTFI